MKKYLFFIVLLSAIVNFYKAQKVELVHPPHWFSDMKYNTLEILVKGKNLSKAKFSLNTKNAKLLDQKSEENTDYVYLTLDLTKTKSGVLPINYVIDGKTYHLPYLIKPRKKSFGKKGLQASDLMYLITPDRFANADATNDLFSDMLENQTDRSNNVGRHGGDLQGIIQHLDYIKSLGMTAIWINPLEENNQGFQSYHGYGITDFYQIDKRFGTTADYQEYVQKSHEKGLKVVKDVVYNHLGNNNILALEPPGATWFNKKSVTNYRIITKFDPYSATDDKLKASDGWFDIPALPDFNQKNLHVSNYLTQYSLWWIEEFDIDAYRIDTFAYPDQDFMWKMMDIIKQEYPSFSIFGEVWETGEATQAYFSKNRTSTQTNLEDIGITDFETQYAMVAICKEETNWNTGLANLYYNLAWDWLYKDPNKNVIFLGNHDIDRYLGAIDNDVQCFKMTTALLLTTRGIPQWYYGDELLFNQKGHHGTIRADFPGGWHTDKENKFSENGRNNTENDYFNYFTKIAQWRKNNAGIINGKLIQFVPENQTYVFFRIDPHTQKTIMVVSNAHKTNESEIIVARYKEVLEKFVQAKEILAEKKFSIKENFKIPARTTWILELE